MGILMYYVVHVLVLIYGPVMQIVFSMSEKQGRNYGADTLLCARTRLLQTVLSHTDTVHVAKDAE